MQWQQRFCVTILMENINNIIIDLSQDNKIQWHFLSLKNNPLMITFWTRTCCRISDFFLYSWSILAIERYDLCSHSLGFATFTIGHFKREYRLYDCGWRTDTFAVIISYSIQGFTVNFASTRGIVLVGDEGSFVLDVTYLNCSSCKRVLNLSGINVTSWLNLKMYNAISNDFTCDCIYV